MNKNEILERWYNLLESYAQKANEIKLLHQPELYPVLMDEIDKILGDETIRLLGMAEMEKMALIGKSIQDASREVQTILYHEQWLHILHWTTPDDTKVDTVLYYMEGGKPIRERYTNIFLLRKKIEELMFSRKFQNKWVKQIDKYQKRQIVIDGLTRW